MRAPAFGQRQGRRVAFAVVRSFLVPVVVAGLLAGCGGARTQPRSRPLPASGTGTAASRRAGTVGSPLIGVLVNSRGHVLARLEGQGLSQPSVVSITSAVSDGNGGWYVAGAFTKVGGVPADGAAHVLANGTVDRWWRPRLTPGSVVALAATTETVYMAVLTRANEPVPAVTPSSPSGYPLTRLLAFSARTGATESAPANPRYPITAMASAGTRLLIGQGAGSGPEAPSCLLAYNTRTRQVVHAFHADIHLAAGDDGNACIRVLAIRGSQLYVGGTFDHVEGIARQSLARLDLKTGTLDPHWRPQHRVDLGTDEIAVGDRLVIINVANGALGALTTTTGAVDRQWVWPPPHEAPRVGLNCCAATRAVIGNQLLIAADSPEILAAINLRTETLTRYPADSSIEAPVDVATPSGGELLAGFSG